MCVATSIAFVRRLVPASSSDESESTLEVREITTPGGGLESGSTRGDMTIPAAIHTMKTVVRTAANLNPGRMPLIARICGRCAQSARSEGSPKYRESGFPDE